MVWSENLGTGILYNRTDGGEGTVGKVWDSLKLESMRQHKIQWHKEHDCSGPNNPMYGRIHSNSTRKKMGRKGTEHSRYDPTLYAFKNLSTGEIKNLTKTEFSQISNSDSALALIKGLLKTSKGWCMA